MKTKIQAPRKIDLSGKRVAVLSADGFEQSELLKPVEALQRCGAKGPMITPDGNAIRGWTKDNWGRTIAADGSLENSDPNDFDGLLLPGGVINSDALRQLPKARQFVLHFMTEGKPTFAICHGSQILIDTDLVEAKRMTSYPAIAEDLRNAGADWEDSEVVVDHGFVTSRSPDDLPAFCEKICEELAEDAA